MSSVEEKQPDKLVYRRDVLIGSYVVALLLVLVVANRDGTQSIIDFATNRPFDIVGAVLLPRWFATSVEQFKNRLRGDSMYTRDIKWLSDNATYNLYTVLYPAFILLCFGIVWQAIRG